MTYKIKEKMIKFYGDNLGAKIGKQSLRGDYRLDLHGLQLNVTKFFDGQTREQKYGMEHIAIDTDELDALVEKLKGQGINILEQTMVSGDRREYFFEGPDGVQHCSILKWVNRFGRQWGAESHSSRRMQR